MTNYKKLVDQCEKYTKDELIEKLVLKTAELLTCEKEVDRLNEYVQIMELINPKTTLGDLKKILQEQDELKESYKQSLKNKQEREENEAYLKEIKDKL